MRIAARGLLLGLLLLPLGAAGADDHGHGGHGAADHDHATAHADPEPDVHGGAHGPSPDFDQPAAFAYSQGALGRIVDGGYRFTDSDGRSVSLEQFRGRPLVISLIYTSCYHTCPMITKSLGQAARIGWQALGTDSFNVLTIGFDTPVDTPERMRHYARSHRAGEAGWHFLSTDAATIEALSRDLGFIYFSSPSGFDHLAQATILDDEGRIYVQVYGETLQAPALVEPLKQLVFGTRTEASLLTNWVNGIKLFCTIYDANTGRYRFDYSPFIGAAIALFSLILVTWFVVRARRGGGPRGRVA